MFENITGTNKAGDYRWSLASFANYRLLYKITNILLI